MPAVPLPATLEHKLDDLATEVRRLRALRGVSWFAAVLFVLPVLAVGVDLIWDLSPLARGAVLGGVVVAALVSFWWLVVRRMRGAVPPAELAAAIEREYPNLSERLQTLVELSEHADAGNGSRAMISLLARDTEKRARRMNFLRAAPFGLSLRLAVCAVLVAVVAVSPLFLFGGAADRLRRVILPWYQPPADVPYTVRVSSGNPVVKRGEPVTLSAYLERTKPTGDLPATATLEYRSPGGTESRRLPMTGDDKAAFTVTRPDVTSDFEYRVECGPVRSDWFTVSAVDPVRIADGTAITITPPGYARDARPEQKKVGLSEIEALQHSTARFLFCVTHPPADAHFEFRPFDGKDDPAAERNVRLRFSGDRRTLTADVPLTADGTLKLTLYGDKGVRTDIPIAVRAVPDDPPRFDKVIGVPADEREVTPESVLTFDLIVTDDIAVGRGFIDFASAGDPPDRFTSEPLSLPAGQKQAAGRTVFPLTGKGKLGDTLRVRVRVQDTRSVPEHDLTPNEITYPDKGWATLMLVANARPLAEQDILAQKEKFRAGLDAIAKTVEGIRDDVATLTRNAAGAESLTDHQSGEVAENRQKIRAAADRLRDLARETEVVPDLRPLARTARDLAADPLTAAEDELRKAGTAPLGEGKVRDAALSSADAALTRAVDQLRRLRQANEDRANIRLDRTRLNELAEEQMRLADAMARATAEERSALDARQNELTDRLSRLTAESDALRKAEKEEDRRQAERLAGDLQNLAERQRQLGEAVQKSEDRARREHLDELMKLQRELNDEADRLAAKTAAAARMSDAKPVDRQPFDRAAERLDRKSPVDAMTEQEKAARELDRLADALAERVQARGDTRAAAEQIARWQHDLARRTADAVKQHPEGLPPADRDRLVAEQASVRKAVERLSLPPSDQLGEVRAGAAAQASEAAEQLRRDPAAAASAQQSAGDAIASLAKQVPSNKDRRAAARDEVERLIRDLEGLQREVETATRDVRQDPDDKESRNRLAEKLAGATAKQDELAKAVQSLDTPGLEARRDRTAAAGRDAAEDMTAGLSQDVPSAQADFRRQLERLRDALYGRTPVDDQAAQLARLQSELTRNLSQVQAPDELQRLQRQQQEVAERLAKLQASEAAGQLAAAQEAASAAARAANQPKPDVDELRKKSRETAQALDNLSARLNGGETPAERLDRVAENRQSEAIKAKDAENSRADLSRTREAQKQTERDLAELNATRTGTAQAAKKKLREVLEQLNRIDQPDKAGELQRQAADAARRLAEVVKRNGNRNGGDWSQPRPVNPDPADAGDPANALPTEQDVTQARDLARRQRELRNDVARSQERSAQGDPTTPTPGDPLGDLAREQTAVANRAAELAEQQSGTAAGTAAGEAAKAARQAAEKFAAGAPADAQRVGAEVVRQLREVAAATPDETVRKTADALADTQNEVSEKAGQVGTPAALARQKARQTELAREAEQLADRIAKAAADGDRAGPQPRNLGQAADGARQAARQMDQAARSARNGKPADAHQARRQAEQALDDAARTALGEPTDRDPSASPNRVDANARTAAEAARQADLQMKQARQQLGQGDPQGAAESGRKAAGQLERSAEQLAKVGSEELRGDTPGQPGQGVSEPGMGGPGTSGEIPGVVFENLGKSWGQLPGEVKSKITAELKAKYGEDYARVIKLYFEQLAERK